MVDSSKRNTLKSLGGMMAAPLLPATLMTTNALAANTSEKDVPLGNIAHNDELSIVLQLNDTPVMRVTNNSDTLTILRRINPGVVHAGTKTYDLNHSLVGSSSAIRAGESRLIPIIEAGSAAAEPSLSPIYKNRPMKMASISADNVKGRQLNSSRAFFV